MLLGRETFIMSGTQTWRRLTHCFLSADNVGDSFLIDGQYIARSKDPEEIERLDKPTFNQVYADITTTFTILIGIFFPSVTGKSHTRVEYRHLESESQLSYRARMSLAPLHRCGWSPDVLTLAS